MRKNLFFILSAIFFVLMGVSVMLYLQARDNVTFHMGTEAFKRGDMENAFEAFDALARQGDVRAMGAVGLMYVRGLGVRQDPTVGAAWLAQACDAGDFEAMHSLGELYAEGNGVPRSRVIALALYIQGARLGGEMARVHAERLEPDLSPEEVARARRLADRFEGSGDVSGIIDRILKKRADDSSQP